MVLVEWLQNSAIQIQGRCRKRTKGDEDMLEDGVAKGLAACGLVRIITDRRPTVADMLWLKGFST